MLYYNITQMFFIKNEETMSLMDSGWVGITLGVAFELATHIVVHYTVPGAAFAASLAEGMSPFLDGIGLTSVFSESAGEAAIASLAPDDPLLGLPGIGKG